MGPDPGGRAPNPVSNDSPMKIDTCGHYAFNE